ncbi:MAG TPA: sulfur oxidation c-type cytochrome SoxX [Sedimenticola sp.]|nr:sulfur oxidation c-type cytochrome SoxX [Sedimenticola sp.]
MHRNKKILAGMVGALALLAGHGIPAAAAAGSSTIEEGKALAFSRKKGNCLACHMIEGGELPGNIAPPLIAMKARYPDREKLRAQIWDATAVNPDSPMPPFGRHKILSDAELDKLVDFIWSL